MTLYMHNTWVEDVQEDHYIYIKDPWNKAVAPLTQDYKTTQDSRPQTQDYIDLRDVTKLASAEYPAYYSELMELLDSLYNFDLPPAWPAPHQVKGTLADL